MIFLNFISIVSLYSGESGGHFGPGAVGEPGKQHCCSDESHPPEGVW